METALSDAELRVMEVIWNEGEASATHITDVLGEQYNYNVSTTRTLISRCLKKGAIERVSPGYICRPLVTREEVQASETDSLIDKMFGGSVDKLFAALVSRKKVSSDDLDRLRQIASDID